MKKKLLILALVAAFFFSIPSALSFPWGPNTHVYMSDQALEACAEDYSCSQSEAYRIIKNNIREFRAGLIAPDFTVLYYYDCIFGEEDPGKPCKYMVTHDWDYVDRCFKYADTDKKKAVCYGKATHMVQDTVAHNDYCPMKIRSFPFFWNFITHMMVEGKIEAVLIERPENAYLMGYCPSEGRCTGITPNSMDVYFEDPELLELVEKALPPGAKDIIDVEYEAERLSFFLGRGEFYDAAEIPEKGWINTLYRGAAGFVKLIATTGDADRWMDKSKVRTMEMWERMDQKTKYGEPHGLTALRDADSVPTMVWSAIFIIGIGLSIFAVFRTLTKRRKR